MVNNTAYGKELFRITLIQLLHVNVYDDVDDDYTNIDIRSEVVFDHFVKPYNPILDYKRMYSGVTARMLEEPTTLRLEQVQAMMSSVHSNNNANGTTILVGHSVEYYLQAVRLIHPTIIDTAILFQHHDEGAKYALRKTIYK
jgi:hypothetical protein